MPNYKNKISTAIIWALVSCLLLLSGCGFSVPVEENIEVGMSVDSNGGISITAGDKNATGTAIAIEIPGISLIEWHQDEPLDFDNANAILPDNFEVGFSPVGTPLRIAVDASGKVSITAEAQFVTTYGVFDITTSKDIIKESKARLLIVRIDNEVNIYELKDKEFQISFINNGEYYRILSFEQDKKGNIQLTLESIK